jgi:hypothetical protein
MFKARLEKLLSQERLKPYYRAGIDYDDALELYKLNIEVSEAFYISLSILEVTLRNTIHASFSQYFKDDFWFKNCLPTDLSNEALVVERKILASKKVASADRIVSELTFGFWTRLFNRKYAQLLWKPLHRVFIHTPHRLRQRAHISPLLNAVRDFRNRIYHYEPIIWNIPDIKQKHDNIIDILSWLDSEIVNWFSESDRVPIMIDKLTQKKANEIR